MARQSRAVGGRDLAFRILQRVETADAYASILLQRMPATADARERALAQEIVLGTLRWRGYLDHALAQFADRPLERLDPAVRTALRMAAYQILRLTRIPSSAAVDESVGLARRAAGRGAAGYVNAVLRALCRGQVQPPRDADPIERMAVEHSHPTWLVARRLRQLGPEEAPRALAVDNLPAPTTLRANRLRADPEVLRARLAAEGVETQPGRWAPDALRVTAGVPVTTEAFRRGWFYLQDEASQLATSLVDPGPGARVADLCAAPGGKATDLAGRLDAGAVVVAGDRHLGRLALLRANAVRLGLERLFLFAGDAERPPLRPAALDRVLVDAPCSGTGILRRHPEIRWRRGEADIRRLAALQARILRRAADLVKPGGVLVYSVCSLEPEEGPEVVDGLLTERGDFRLMEPSAALPAELLVREGAGAYLRTWPHRHDLDGFYAAALRRSGAPPGPR